MMQVNMRKKLLVDSVIIASSERRIVDMSYLIKAGEFDITHSTPEKTYHLGKITVLSSSFTVKDNSDFLNTKRKSRDNSRDRFL